MWPFCRQPLYAGAMPLMFNATILNGMSLTGRLEEAPTWTPADDGGRLLDVQVGGWVGGWVGGNSGSVRWFAFPASCCLPTPPRCPPLFLLPPRSLSTLSSCGPGPATWPSTSG